MYNSIVQWHWGCKNWTHSLKRSRRCKKDCVRGSWQSCFLPTRVKGWHGGLIKMVFGDHFSNCFTVSFCITCCTHLSQQYQQQQHTCYASQNTEVQRTEKWFVLHHTTALKYALYMHHIDVCMILLCMTHRLLVIISRVSDQNGESLLYHAWDTPFWSGTLDL